MAVTAIFKDEVPYLKEWLDYHLLAGAEHFYLYNNDSTDDYKEILTPYVENNLVTLTDFPGKLMMYPAYDDAIDKYRFECRYMAFIDIDEFVYPKRLTADIISVVDEILSVVPNAAGLAINWQIFGSNGQDKADYSRGVLERFTRRALSDWTRDGKGNGGNTFRKTIDNPRLVRYRINPHFAYYFDGKAVVNANGEFIGEWYGNQPIITDKIVVNHYAVKSKEECFKRKVNQKSPCMDINVDMEEFKKYFSSYDRNEVFDDSILKYRAARAERFSFESEDARFNRVMNAIVKNLTADKISLEAALTCRALAGKFDIKILNQSAEELALNRIYRILATFDTITVAEIQMFLKALPEILDRPFDICKKINQLTCEKILPRLCEALKDGDVFRGLEHWKLRSDSLYIQRLLRLIK